jgi:uncharacterized protein YndB with AHSA1/START domain
MPSNDRIERSIVLKASRGRVWRALTHAPEFGTWFRAALHDQTFAPGAATRGPITYAGYEHVQFDVVVERMEPESYFSWRWHPYAVEPGVDYSGEPTTLVEFTLEDTEDGGTRLTVVESGFDALPAQRRDEAYRMNTGGWEGQMDNIAAHLGTPTSHPNREA